MDMYKNGCGANRVQYRLVDEGPYGYASGSSGIAGSQFISGLKNIFISLEYQPVSFILICNVFDLIQFSWYFIWKYSYTFRLAESGYNPVTNIWRTIRQNHIISDISVDVLK